MPSPNTPSMFPKAPKGTFEAGSFLLIALLTVLNTKEELTNPQLVTVVVLCILASIISIKK